MDLYPLDLVLTTSLAWATIFLGALPTSLLRKNVFARLVGFAGVGWLLVAVTVPLAIVHYYIVFALLCFYAWRQLREDCALRGKVWLMVAAGLGVSLGVVLILVVTPGADLGNDPEFVLLLSLILGYLVGATVGLAIMLYFFTRREATRAEIPTFTVRKCGNWLLALSIVRGVISVFGPDWGITKPPSTPSLELFLGPSISAWLEIAAVVTSLLLVPALSWVGRSFANSPAPSRSGPAFLLVAALGILTELCLRLSGVFAPP